MYSIGFMIPLFLIRYTILSFVDKSALSRAAFFPPMRGTQRIMYWIYQVSTISFKLGLVVFLSGIIVLILATISFGKPGQSGINKSGLYCISRNPMYVAYFIYFLGCVILTRSVILLFLVIVFQIASHWIILSEEEWCIHKFGEEYVPYMKKVRRYI